VFSFDTTALARKFAARLQMCRLRHLRGLAGGGANRDRAMPLNAPTHGCLPRCRHVLAACVAHPLRFHQSSRGRCIKA
jgi:hypothetical protein